MLISVFSKEVYILHHFLQPGNINHRHANCYKGRGCLSVYLSVHCLTNTTLILVLVCEASLTDLYSTDNHALCNSSYDVDSSLHSVKNAMRYRTLGYNCYNGHSWLTSWPAWLHNIISLGHSLPCCCGGRDATVQQGTPCTVPGACSGRVNVRFCEPDGEHCLKDWSGHKFMSQVLVKVD